MDTKSKKNKPTALIVILILAAMSVAFVACYPFFNRNTGSEKYSYYNTHDFSRELARARYAFLWKAALALDPKSDPLELFFPECAEALSRLEDGEHYVDYDIYGFSEYVRDVFDGYLDEFVRTWKDTDYILYLDGGQAIKNGFADLPAHFGATNEEIYESLRTEGRYGFYAVIEYKLRGVENSAPLYGTEITSLYGAKLASAEMISDFPGEDWRSAFDSYNIPSGLREIRVPEMTLVIGIPNEPVGYGVFAQRNDYYDRVAFESSGFKALYICLLAAAALLAFILALAKFDRFGALGCLPPELAIGAAALIFAYEPLGLLALRVFSGRFELIYIDYTLYGNQAVYFAYASSAVSIFLIICAVFFTVFSIVRGFAGGPADYIVKRSIIIATLRYIFKWLAAVWKWLIVKPSKTIYRRFSDIDLSDKVTKDTLKILALNFLVVTVLCCFWFFGIIGLAVYTVLLYIAIRRAAKDISEKYNRTLYAVSEIAAGKLDAEIPGELGLLSPFGAELGKVQAGFRRAVAEETKSQRMKAELLTNVSHDLKTPLTAIITYVGLLKNEDATSDERASYIETLDRKSQRLKSIIDDLFEVSRASSGNISLNLSEVDLPALIRQVLSEASVEESGVDFRFSAPEVRITLMLDGDKCSRIFENLVQNIAKYALPGTRAYISVVSGDGEIAVELKNISRDALDFDISNITERFVRGDSSRSTEGSGLGLAIARSFTELQGGRFAVAADGDLFKVSVTFPKS